MIYPNLCKSRPRTRLCVVVYDAGELATTNHVQRRRRSVHATCSPLLKMSLDWDSASLELNNFSSSACPQCPNEKTTLSLPVTIGRNGHSRPYRPRLGEDGKNGAAALTADYLSIREGAPLEAVCCPLCCGLGSFPAAGPGCPADAAPPPAPPAVWQSSNKRPPVASIAAPSGAPSTSRWYRCMGSGTPASGM